MRYERHGTPKFPNVTDIGRYTQAFLPQGHRPSTTMHYPPIDSAFSEALRVSHRHSAGPRDILSLRSVSVHHGSIYVPHQQVTKLCYLDWEHQPAALAAPDAQHPRRCHSHQVVRLSPAEGLKGHQDKMKYSSLSCAICYSHWPSIRFLLEMVVRGNRRPRQTGNDTTARTPSMGLP